VWRARRQQSATFGAPVTYHLPPPLSCPSSFSLAHSTLSVAIPTLPRCRTQTAYGGRSRVRPNKLAQWLKARSTWVTPSRPVITCSALISRMATRELPPVDKVSCSLSRCPVNRRKQPRSSSTSWVRLSISVVLVVCIEAHSKPFAAEFGIELYPQSCSSAS